MRNVGPCKHSRPWSSPTIGHGPLGDKEDAAYRKQFSTGSLKKLQEVFKRQEKVSTGKRVKLYNT